MRMLAVYHKGEKVRFVSHLDVMRVLHRAFRRAGIPLKYSEGFNPHPELSFASALSTGMTSDAEWFEVLLERDMEPASFMKQVNSVLPEGFFVSDAQPMPDGIKTIASLTRGAMYSIEAVMDGPFDREIGKAVDDLLSGEIIVNKRTKSGVKPVDIRPFILDVVVEGIEDNRFKLRVLGRLQADGGLRAELFMGALFDRLDAHGLLHINRSAMFFESDGSLPRMPLE